MASQLTAFLQQGFDESAPVIGHDSMTVGSVTIVGTMSGLSGSNEGEEGGLQATVNATMLCKSSSEINLGLIGKIATGVTGVAVGQTLRVENLDINKAFTTVYFVHATTL